MAKRSGKQRAAKGARGAAGRGGEAAARQPATDQAKIRLPLFGEEREVTCEVRLGPRGLRDLLPAAREISRQIAAASVAQAEGQGRSLSCRAGCAHCCRQLVPLSPVEAVALAELVAGMPGPKREAVRRRFASAVARLEELGLLDRAAPRGRFALQSEAPADAAWEDARRRYFAASIPCPFLEDERCMAYEHRPFACREYAVTSTPDRCATLDPGLQVIDRPIYMDAVMTGVCARFAGLPEVAVPLPLALEWAEVHGHLTRGVHDGEAMFWELLEQFATVDRGEGA